MLKLKSRTPNYVYYSMTSMCKKKKKLSRDFLKIHKKLAARITDKRLISLIYKGQPKINIEKDLQTKGKLGNGYR